MLLILIFYQILNKKISLKIIFVMLNLIHFLNFIMNKFNLKFIEYLCKRYFIDFNANFQNPKSF
jgi:hypothetical protein